MQGERVAIDFPDFQSFKKPFKGGGLHYVIVTILIHCFSFCFCRVSC